jgi:hypothetical protein
MAIIILFIAGMRASFSSPWHKFWLKHLIHHQTIHMKILKFAAAVLLTGSSLMACKKDSANGTTTANGAEGYFKGSGKLTNAPGTTFQVFLLNRANGTARLYSNYDITVTDTAQFDHFEGFWNLNNREYNGTFDRTIISGTLDANGNVITGNFTNPIQATFTLSRQ